MGEVGLCSTCCTTGRQPSCDLGSQQLPPRFAFHQSRLERHERKPNGRGCLWQSLCIMWCLQGLERMHRAIPRNAATELIELFKKSCPRGSTTIVELGPQSHYNNCLLGPNSIVAVYVDPLGAGLQSPFIKGQFHNGRKCGPSGIVSQAYRKSHAGTLLVTLNPTP